MKTQMRFQKIIFKVTLVIAALAIFYAFAFCTGAIAYMANYTDAYSYSSTGKNWNGEVIVDAVFGGEANYNAMCDLYYTAQSYTNILMWLGIAFILLVIVCYIFAGSKRRNYYLANYITVGIVVVYAIVWAAIAIAFSAQVQSGIANNAGWLALGNYIDNLATDETDIFYLLQYAEKSALKYSTSSWIYSVGYVLSAIVIVDAIALVMNLIWKFKLMKGEKQLLANGLVKEVA